MDSDEERFVDYCPVEEENTIFTYDARRSRRICTNCFYSKIDED